MHRYDYTFDGDGDYIEHIKLVDGQWVLVSRWLIPGTQL